jgi:hypothetical protein
MPNSTLRIEIGRHADDLDLATTEGDAQEEEERRYQPAPTPYLGGEKVGGHEDIHVDMDEFPPGCGLLALRGRGDPVAFQDVPHRLVTDVIAQVGQGALNAVIPPRAILAGHPHHQVFDLLVDTRTANRRARLGGVNLLVGKGTVPGEDCIGLRNGGDFCQGLSPKLLTKLG